jgi:hypothetical protein
MSNGWIAAQEQKFRDIQVAQMDSKPFLSECGGAFVQGGAGTSRKVQDIKEKMAALLKSVSAELTEQQKANGRNERRNESGEITEDSLGNSLGSEENANQLKNPILSKLKTKSLQERRRERMIGERASDRGSQGVADLAKALAELNLLEEDSHKGPREPQENRKDLIKTFNPRNLWGKQYDAIHDLEGMRRRIQESIRIQKWADYVHKMRAQNQTERFPDAYRNALESLAGRLADSVTTLDNPEPVEPSLESSLGALHLRDVVDEAENTSSRGTTAKPHAIIDNHDAKQIKAIMIKQPHANNVNHTTNAKPQKTNEYHFNLNLNENCDFKLKSGGGKFTAGGIKGGRARFMSNQEPMVQEPMIHRDHQRDHHQDDHRSPSSVAEATDQTSREVDESVSPAKLDEEGAEANADANAGDIEMDGVDEANEEAKKSDILPDANEDDANVEERKSGDSETEKNTEAKKNTEAQNNTVAWNQLYESNETTSTPANGSMGSMQNLLKSTPFFSTQQQSNQYNNEYNDVQPHANHNDPQTNQTQDEHTMQNNTQYQRRNTQGRNNQATNNPGFYHGRREYQPLYQRRNPSGNSYGNSYYHQVNSRDQFAQLSPPPKIPVTEEMQWIIETPMSSEMTFELRRLWMTRHQPKENLQSKENLNQPKDHLNQGKAPAEEVC